MENGSKMWLPRGYQLTEEFNLEPPWKTCELEKALKECETIESAYRVYFEEQAGGCTLIIHHCDEHYAAVAAKGDARVPMNVRHVYNYKHTEGEDAGDDEDGEKLADFELQHHPYALKNNFRFELPHLNLNGAKDDEHEVQRLRFGVMALCLIFMIKAMLSVSKAVDSGVEADIIEKKHGYMSAMGFVKSEGKYIFNPSNHFLYCGLSANLIPREPGGVLQKKYWGNDEMMKPVSDLLGCTLIVNANKGNNELLHKGRKFYVFLPPDDGLNLVAAAPQGRFMRPVLELAAIRENPAEVFSQRWSEVATKMNTCGDGRCFFWAVIGSLRAQKTESYFKLPTPVTRDTHVFPQQEFPNKFSRTL